MSSTKRLRQLRPDLVERRHVAWDTLYSPEPEAPRQASLSIRGLLSDTLEILAPKAGRTQRQQLKSAFALNNSASKTAVEYVDAQVTLVIKLVELLSSSGKSGPRPTASQAEEAIRTTEASLRRLLGIVE